MVFILNDRYVISLSISSAIHAQFNHAASNRSSLCFYGPLAVNAKRSKPSIDAAYPFPMSPSLNFADPLPIVASNLPLKLQLDPTSLVGITSISQHQFSSSNERMLHQRSSRELLQCCTRYMLIRTSCCLHLLSLEPRDLSTWTLIYMSNQPLNN